MDAERLGQQLRASREAQELTLDQVEQTTRIRAKFLAAFESGDYDDLPGVVQARGFLRNYARFLKLDEESAVAQFDLALKDSKSRPHWKPRTEPTRPISPAVPLVVEPAPTYDEPEYPLEGEPGNRRRISIILGAIAGVVILVVACIAGLPFFEQVLSQQSGAGGPNFMDVLPTVPSVTPSTTFVPSQTPQPGQQVAAALGPVITDRVVIVINVVQRTWVRVIADGATVYEGLAAPGATLEYEAVQTLNLQASNAAGLDVIFNNLPLGVLGGRGEAVDRTFTPDLALTPTAVLEPTFTPTSPPLPGLQEATAAPLPGGDTGLGDATATPLLPPGVEPPTAAPNAEGNVTSGEAAGQNAPPTQITFGSPTPAPSSTAMPTATPTPSPTVNLPPRLTSTPDAAGPQK